jgi:hypothetical protein
MLLRLNEVYGKPGDAVAKKLTDAVKSKTGRMLKDPW